MTITIYLLIAVLLLLLNGFFVLAEFAAVKVRPTRIEALAGRGDARAKVMQYIQSHLDQYLSVCQVGITFCSIGLGFVAEPSLVRLIQPLVHWAGSASASTAHAIAFVIAYIIVSFLHIVIGELVPKSIAIRATEPAALRTAKPLRFFYYLFFAPLWVLNASSNAILRLLGLPFARHDDHSDEEVRIILGQTQSSGLLSFRRLLLMENVLDLGGLTVRDAMRPRAQVKLLRTTATRAENDAVITEARFSRYLLVGADAERPIGVVHVKDLYMAERRGQPVTDLATIARPFVTTRESTLIEGVLADMQRRAVHLAVVLGEHDRWTGFISMEDAIEEVIGTIEEEFPTEPPLHIADVLSPSQIVLDVDGDSIKSAVAAALTRVGAAGLPGDLAALTAAVLQRENLSSTYVGRGVAMPHARIADIAKPTLIVARVRESLAAPSGDDRIDLLFIILTPAGMPRIHQRLQALIAGILDSVYVEERLRAVTTPVELMEALETAEQATIG